ncbi:MAG: hypothetical protein AAFQ80_22520 [Cyanobacteria bacterium J06621_8]
MLAIDLIREKDLDEKWRQQKQAFQELMKRIELEQNSFKTVLLIILEDIQNLEDILLFKQDQTLEFAEDYKKIAFQRNLLRIEISFYFLSYLLSQTDISYEQKIHDFLIGIANIAATLICSGDRLKNVTQEKTRRFIRNLLSYLQVWENLSHSIDQESILLQYDDAAKLIYTSLCILQNLQYYLNNNQNISEKNNYWLQEQEIFNSLLADMKNGSQESWSSEEQQAFKRAMSNLS